MVKVISYAQRENALGEKFYALILQSGLELVQSKTTGKYYATAKRASITSTFDENSCKSMIGQEIKGSIRKVECDPFEYTIAETGEVITQDHRWEYVMDEETLEENLIQSAVIGAEA